MSNLRGSVIRLAHSKPELRPLLLPLLKTSSGITFDSSGYEATYRSEPVGDGVWAFSFGVESLPSNSPDIFWSPSSSYPVAKQAALQEAIRQGFEGVIYHPSWR